ncbi:MAG: Rqc2 family fibronectin-binding protein [Candidatus Heteroscillospira sp.]|jgi:predicted ribosome quality control (RQC) complex YloA/Tae2 family protein
MPLDAICLRALTGELAPRLTGMKIDKVQMPERDLVVLSLRGGRETLRLLLSASVGSARVHLTEERFENPKAPPMFCMLLRKHLQGAVISGLTQPGNERMLILELDAYDELGVFSHKQFIVEMIGRSSNFILVGGDGRIIDCLRRVDYEMSEKRQILPGLIYHLPPEQEKPAFLDCADRAQLWESAQPEQRADKWLLDTFSGLSPLICRELCYRCFGDSSPRVEELTTEQRERFPAIMDAMAESVQAGEFTPYMLMEEDRPRDFSFMALRQYEHAAQGAVYPDFSQLIEGFYLRRERAERMRHRSRELLKSVKTRYERLRRKLETQRQELQKTGERETLKRSGDLITANMYRVKKGDRVLECEDFYDEKLPTVTVKLDFMKTPQQNAGEYYKAYNKAKAAEQHLTALIADGERELDYLGSVLDEIQRAESEAELGEIRRELMELNYLRQPKGRREKIKEAQPRRFLSDSGLEILVGRNNAQNDRLTTRDARRTDIWLHVQKIHGSHVILCCNGDRPDDLSLEQAASLAAYYSQGREAGKVPVDYTQVRFVKKPSGSMPGKVIYTDYRTIMAQPDEALAERLAVKK